MKAGLMVVLLSLGHSLKFIRKDMTLYEQDSDSCH